MNSQDFVRRVSVLDKVICFFALLLAISVGLILGAVFAETLLPALYAITAFAAAMAAAVIALLIYRCRRCS